MTEKVQSARIKFMLLLKMASSASGMASMLFNVEVSKMSRGSSSIKSSVASFTMDSLCGLLPFLLMMLAGVWYALHVSYKRGEVLEELNVTAETAHLTRHNPKGPAQEWQANRYWVSVHLHPKGGPVPNYITLRGGDREVELGAFLDAEERANLYNELKGAFR